MLISVHIPKAAGGTFARALKAAFGKRLVFDFGDPYGFVDPDPPDIAMLAWRKINAMRGVLRRRQLFVSLRSDTQCIHGHFLATKYLKRFPQARLITWLRDPVERIASHYYYWLRRPDFGHSVCRRLHREGLSLSEFAALPPMRNLQSRYLDGLDIERFWFVGIQEQFDDLLEAFFYRLGMDAPKAASRHVNPEKAGEIYTLSDELRTKIAALNVLDCSLYDQARKRIKLERNA